MNHPQDNEAIVLLSGGMDSVTALHHAHAAGPVLTAVSFDYGSKHNVREISFAKWHCDELGIKHQVVALDFFTQLFTSSLLDGGAPIPDGHYAEANMKQTVVPFRNGIMLAIAAGIAENHGAGRLVIAAHSGDHAIYPDCRESFMQGMATAVEEGTYARVRIDRPFIHLGKAAIAARGTELGIDFRQTWSCYKGGDIHCGTCGTCVERREAFLLANIIDPTEYLATPPLPATPSC
ncbi:MAG TPA: 7-cyano-7-deazaguanine synthase QueC [Verrucomicrobiales bacterium]|nr:MAG: 7-cyano-7-deazaguanine synthase QueC [Verrucomicrobiae bacterium Tous-C3TDCM]PAZ06505.1 MAG: 7-cyano-7-deazaguanine synthase QueC [Verrucomicrobiae bacterium AMD-G2]HBE23552.1 7-cyano-7-deazaguanine synthase QueC [Verrucomicrobiales bacterium]